MSSIEQIHLNTRMMNTTWLGQSWIFHAQP